jgi:hypothetical protein
MATFQVSDMTPLRVRLWPRKAATLDAAQTLTWATGSCCG